MFVYCLLVCNHVNNIHKYIPPLPSGEGRGEVQTGNMIYRLNREHGLHKLSSWQGGTTYAVERDLCDEPATTIYQ